jgi:hypothetical protein
MARFSLSSACLLLFAALAAQAGCSDPGGHQDLDGEDDAEAVGETDGEAPDAPACSPGSCEGCCDGGVCRLGMDDAACGTGGEACRDCAGGGGRCVESACLMPGCGDGVAAGEEECDGSDLGGADCESLGFAAGALACSPSCTLDTSACENLTCEIAASDPDRYPCDFCSADAGSMIYCGFCREDPITGLQPPDEIAPCDTGEACYHWFNAIDGKDEYFCLSGPPEPCPADFTEGRCEGETAVYCTPNGLMERFDCTSLGQRCVMATSMGGTLFPTCVEQDAEPCTPGSHTDRCDGNDIVICYEVTRYENWVPCDPGTACIERGARARCIEEGWVSCDPSDFTARCEGDALVGCEALFFDDPTLGGVEVPEDCGAGRTCADTAAESRCVQEGTESCDAAAYVSHCEGDLVMSCWAPIAWEIFTDCSLMGEAGLMTCQTFSSGPTCAPRDYTPCDPLAYPPQCNGSTASECRQPGWLVERPCSGLNPTCVAGEYTADCSFPDAPSCAFDMLHSLYETDRWGNMVHTMPLRCLDGGTLVVCDDYLQIEMLRACGSGLHCETDPDAYPDLDAACVY